MIILIENINYRIQVVPGLITWCKVSEWSFSFNLFPQFWDIRVVLSGGGSHNAQCPINMVNRHNWKKQERNEYYDYYICLCFTMCFSVYLSDYFNNKILHIIGFFLIKIALLVLNNIKAIQTIISYIIGWK